MSRAIEMSREVGVFRDGEHDRVVLFPMLDRPTDADGDTDAVAMRFPEGTLTWRELREASLAVADQIAGCTRVAVWAEPSLDTAVAVIGALLAGVTVLPLNPGIGTIELDHIVSESQPEAILCGRDAALPARLAVCVRQAVCAAELVNTRDTRDTRAWPSSPASDAPALVIYTSGTTGLPKGAVLSYRAVAANLDGLAAVWQWTARDVLVHALPLFHVHGLVLGTLGPVRVGSPVVHAGRFSPEAIAAALTAGGTMLFGVPTMYHRLAKAAETDATIVEGLRRARVLVSGSAPLAAQDRDAIERLTGQRVIERYGLTETLIVCAMPAGDRRIGVGPPVPGVEVRLVDDKGEIMPMFGENEALGEVEVRGPSVFSGYLHRPDATARAMHDGWFRTGDTAIRDATGSYRIVGRTALDVIKTGGFKVGAGEVEDALRVHPHVADVAVTGEPDDDLGQRIVAWVVAHADCTPDPADLEAHVARTLSSHKRPRLVVIVDALPRNAMGKVEKRKLVR
jgi:malonyl-CoA/methylmalonyl-CoA synthetase